MTDLIIKTDQLSKLEAGLVERLKTFLPSPYYIAPFPDKPEDFDMARMEAVCLVHYSGSRYSKPADQIRQVRELQFTLALYIYALRGGAEDERLHAYGAIETIRRAAQNVRLDGCKPFYLVSDQLVGQQAGRWDWQIDIACETTAIAAEHNIPSPRYPLNRARQEV
ncbi:Gp37 family protein [uncultured Cohaesibacter sp.]|uniref:Gp37 family protein n=1 Tax=uncultured Cohaesibacter sp. TaxID=1002546 RepID=UPI0029C95B7C|nr:Gp37 family protein [uncultured Cohaesibacter sp.]